MKDQDNYKVKDTIICGNNKEYAIIKKVDDYYLFLSIEQPLEILVGTIEKDKINIITDKNIIEKVLTEEVEEDV